MEQTESIISNQKHAHMLLSIPTTAEFTKKKIIFDFIYIYDGASAGAKKKVNEVIKKMESANLTLDVRR